MAATSDAVLVPHDHVVHFHNDDAAFVDVVGGYLTAAVLDHDVVVIIASSPHRAAFESALTSAGCDIAAAVADGSLVTMDAVGILDSFVIDGSPDAEKFEQVVGEVIRAAGASGRPVRAYGEMVAVLWQNGNLAGAIELERMWNALGERLAFSLFCAYPLSLATDAKSGDAYAELCHLHSDVVGGAPTPDDGGVSQRFAPSSQAPRQARKFVEATLTEWNRRDLLDDSLLVASELVTNAVKHAGSDVTVSLALATDGVTLLVGDASVDPPIARAPDLAAPGGRGLHLVDAVARRWGHRPAAVGKFVWAHLA